MSDKANTPQPDRAGDGFDDLDVPTYEPQKSGREKPVSEKPVPAKSATAEKSTKFDKAAPVPEKPATAAPSTASLYERIGRAAPQNIPANPKQKAAAAAAEPVVRESDSTETASFAATSRAAATGGGATVAASTSKEKPPTVGDRSEPLRSDAPTTSFDSSPKPGTPAAAAKTTQIPRESSYQDTDFAPTSSGATVQPSTPESSSQPFNQPMTGTNATGATASGAYTGGAVAAADQGAVDTTDDARDTSKDGKRGTIDFGLLMIRVLLGAYLVLTSVATFFQLGGNEGLAGLESQFTDYALPNVLAILVPSMQLAAGVFLIFGLITPLFAALATVVTSFTALHALAGSGAGLNIFAWDDSVMLSVILLVISLALQFTGPGLYSFDFGRGWARRPLASSWIFVVLGIAGAVALWWFGAGINPLN